jgi:hypothetical protein
VNGVGEWSPEIPTKVRLTYRAFRRVRGGSGGQPFGYRARRSLNTRVIRVAPTCGGWYQNGGAARLPAMAQLRCSLGIIRSLLSSVGLQPLMDLERGVHMELPVHALLPWPEVGGRLRHRDYLGPVDLVGVPVGHNGR